MDGKDIVGCSKTAKSPPAVSLRIAGSWTGVIDVNLDTCTVRELREEVSSLSRLGAANLKLIAGGRVLKDGLAGCLRSAGLTESSKLLVTGVAAAQVARLQTTEAEIAAEVDKGQRLSRLRAAVEAMGRRNAVDSFTGGGYELQLENQAGQQLAVSEEERRTLVMGLFLHERGRKLLKKEQLTEAVEVLQMAEEAFSLASQVLTEGVDNVALLQIDLVWCFFLLRDIGYLAAAQDRLRQARNSLARAHGPHLERMRVYQGGFQPELAVYVRLELLEGVVAYHTGQLAEAKRSLLSAKAKFDQLQVSDDAIAALASMGFRTQESVRALRMSGQDVERAASFVLEQRQRAEAKAEEERRQKQLKREQKAFGRTASGKAVDLALVRQLAFCGYDRSLAGEALRQVDNNFEAALNTLTNQDTVAALQVAVSMKSDRRRPLASQEVPEDSIAALIALGYSRRRAISALEQVGDDPAAAAEWLLRGAGQRAALGPAGAPSIQDGTEAGGEEGTEGGGREEDLEGKVDENSAEKSVDKEMEAEIAADVTNDPLASYDLDVERDGQAIFEYLSLMASPEERQGQRLGLGS